MTTKKWKNIGLELAQGATYIPSDAETKDDAEKECLAWVVSVLLQKHFPESQIKVEVDELRGNGRASLRLDVDKLQFDADAWSED